MAAALESVQRVEQADRDGLYADLAAGLAARTLPSETPRTSTGDHRQDSLQMTG